MKDIHSLMEIFSERLKGLMIERDYNIQKLSTATNIPFTTIDSWILKKRSPKIDNICIIADHFGVSIDYLFGREN